MKMDSHTITRTYTSDPLLSRPGDFFHELGTDFLNSRELAWRLFLRGLSAKYRQTLLGYFWAVLPPVATTLVFLLLREGGVVNTGDTGMPYVAFLLISTSLWTLFSDAVGAPLRMMTASKAMLIKINFPREAVVFASMGEVIFNFLLRMVLVVGIMAWYQILPPVTVLLFPLGVASLLLMGIALGVLLLPLGMLYQDIVKMLPMLMNIWMLLTPVVYVGSNSGVRGELMRWNPVSPVLTTTRDWLVTGATPYLHNFATIMGVTFVLLLAGWLLFRLAMPHVISRLGG